MKKTLLTVLFLLFTVSIFVQGQVPKKYALVIGNGDYTGLSRLANPVNDANDITASLASLGFTVEILRNARQEQMDSAVMRLKDWLSADQNSYGFFFFAGHGVQSGGENYLIPVNANIPDENFLRSRAVSVQTILDVLNDAGNSLNVVVLDACRDNPFGWSRSGSRGLAVLNRQPADSIIVYATSSGQTASDGQGRNGLFTTHLLQNIKEPGIEVSELFRRTGADVSDASNRRQIPAVYNQFFGTAYLGTRPQGAFETGNVIIATGALHISTVSAGTLEINGTALQRTLAMPEWGHLPIEKISAGNYRVVMRYADGNTEEKTVTVGRNVTAALEFVYQPAPPKPPEQPVEHQLIERQPAERQPRERLPRERQPRERLPRERQPKEREPLSPEAARLNSIGVSLGSTFSAPMLAATLRGTFAPTRFSFLEAGVDIGMLSGVEDAGYFSAYPFIHYNLFLPFGVLPSGKNMGGWYAGIGAGWMIGRYTLPEDTVPVNIFAFDVVTGFVLWNFLDISYTLRTDFNGFNHKASVGYVYRFR